MVTKTKQQLHAYPKLTIYPPKSHSWKNEHKLNFRGGNEYDLVETTQLMPANVEAVIHSEIRFRF